MIEIYPCMDGEGCDDHRRLLLPGMLLAVHVPTLIAAEIERLQACERALEIAETALQRISRLRGIDGYGTANDALTAIATLRTTQEAGGGE